MNATWQSLKKPALLWFFVIFCLHLSERLGGLWPQAGSILVLASAGILLYVPMLIGWRQKQKITYLDWNLAQARQSLTWLFWVCVIVFPPFLLANHFYQSWIFHKSFSGVSFAGAALYFFNHCILVALPEEVFFRGYLEGELTRVWPLRAKLWGAPFGGAIMFSALVFAFSHSLVHFQWWHFSIFFPALLFSWLRQKTGAIWAGAVFHAACNLIAHLISKSYS